MSALVTEGIAITRLVTQTQLNTLISRVIFTCQRQQWKNDPAEDRLFDIAVSCLNKRKKQLFDETPQHRTQVSLVVL